MMNVSNESEDSILDIDWRYEFSAPKFHDFTNPETEADVFAAERWFGIAVPYENSPHVAKTKSIPELWSTARSKNHGGKIEALKILAHVSPKPDSAFEVKDEEEFTTDNIHRVPQNTAHLEEDTNMVDKGSPLPLSSTNRLEEEPYTPQGRAITGVIENHPNRTPPSALAALVISPGVCQPSGYTQMPGRSYPWPYMHLAHNPKTGSRLQDSSHGRSKTPTTTKEPIITSSMYLNQAQKKQKLEGGRLQKLLYMKDRLPRPKNPPTLTIPHEFLLRTETRAQIHQGGSSKVSPFVSMAERIRRFHMKTPERYRVRSRNTSSQDKEHEQEKAQLKLTVAKPPELETSQRARLPKVKSAAELEEEMLAKIPKFRARPLRKKIFEAPSLPSFTRSAPHMTEFQEFHLHTMDRAQHYASTSTSTSGESVPTSQNVPKSTRDLPKPRLPQLETASRARPSTLKSREELEEEELAKMPKFKARPINRMIFESKGELGVPRNQKREVTMPQEFHFKTDERAQSRQPDSLTDQLLKLSLNKASKEEAPLRPTKPKPFRLATDDRGLAKEMRDIQEKWEQQKAEMRARIPKANPLPCSTDYAEVPPKPLPKECTKPEPFYLESLLRHEREQERLAQERMQAEQLEIALREFHAQPILSDVQATLPERQRKPLTAIEEFNLLVDQRAIEREEFERKVAEKQQQYKRYRQEYDAARKAEEENFIKAMRREMVPTARPMPTFSQPCLTMRSAKEPTKPVSPQLLRRIRRNVDGAIR